MRIGTAVPTKYYEQTAQFGYDYIEFAGVEISAMAEDDFVDLVARVKKAGLPVKGYNAYCNGDVPIVGDGYSREKAESYARLMCERGKALGIESIGIGAPFARMIPPDYDEVLADKQAVEFVSVTADIAREYGIKVLFEAVHEHMCDYCNYTSHCKKIIDIVNKDNVEMILDFYHVEVMGEDIMEALSTEGISHLHINMLLENYGRGYITDNDEEYLRFIAGAIEKSEKTFPTITIEAEAQYFETYGAEGLRTMRKYF